MSMKDLTGQKFTHWTVLSHAGSDKHGFAVWLCHCDCGTEKTVLGISLRKGTSVSCGCLRKLNLVGRKFGRLTVIEEAGRSKHGNVTWRCVCACDGKEIIISGGNLNNSHTESCGCLQKERAREVCTTHGHANRSLTYSSWSSMKARCLNPNDGSFPRYGGRGITICERWLGEHGFENFLADMGERPEGKTLDRKKSNGNYEPDNCRWLDLSGQAINRRKIAGTTSKYRGVSLANNGKKFVASIAIDKEQVYLGRFDSEESAAIAYNEAAKQHHGDLAQLNEVAA